MSSENNIENKFTLEEIDRFASSNFFSDKFRKHDILNIICARLRYEIIKKTL
jgi:hypothetical protein